MEYVNQGATCTSASAYFAECWNAISRRADVLALKDDLDREAFVSLSGRLCQEEG